MKRTMTFLLSVTLGFLLAVAVPAQEKKAMKQVTVIGEIIDTKCYLTGMMGGRGEEHKECAISCIKGGLPVAILENKTNKVYLLAPKKGMKGGNDELAQYAAENVKITGTIAQKGGQKLLVYEAVEKTK